MTPPTAAEFPINPLALVPVELEVDPAERFLAVVEDVDESRVELCPGSSLDLGDRVLPASGAPIRPLARHRVERVRDREDASPERDLVGREVVGIALAVPALVVRADDAGSLSSQQGRFSDHLLAEDGVRLD